ncbi:MAG: pilus assembly protein CpaE [Planctomycetaceae bacterium]
MKSVFRLALVDPNDGTRSILKKMLLGVDIVWLEAESSRYEFFPDVVMQTQPDIALIALDSSPEAGLHLVSKIVHDLPHCCVLVISSSQEGSLILQAIRNGAKEFLNSPLKIDDFLAAIDRIRSQRGGHDGETQAKVSQVITVCGVSGGVGCTSMGVNLACTFTQDDTNSVVIIDLDLAMGDADVWLDIIPDYTIQDVAENITRLDYSLLKRSLTKHDTGVCLLPRPVEMEDRAPITPDELKRVVSLLKSTFSHLVLDISKSYNPLDMAALEIADSILLVTQLDLPCLRNVVRLLQFFERYEKLIQKVKVVVNRHGLDDTQISMTKAMETIGREIFFQIPNDYRTMIESRNNGIPLIMQAPKAKLTKAFEQMALLLDGNAATVSDVEDPKKKRRLFSFLGGQK